MGSSRVAISHWQVHYFGNLSVHDVALIQGVDEYVIADFFNTVANVNLTGSQADGSARAEPRFPFGGYWQALREGTTAGDVRQLRALVHASLGKDSEHVRNAATFRSWYRQAENRRTALFAQLVEVLGAMARRSFAPFR